MENRSTRIKPALLLSIAILSLAACGGGGGGNNSTSSTPQPVTPSSALSSSSSSSSITSSSSPSSLPESSSSSSSSSATANLSGTWQVLAADDGSECGEGISSYTTNYTVVHTDNSLRVTVDNNTYTGTVSGKRLIWSGSYEEDGGTTTLSVTADIDGETIQGSSRWTYRYEDEFCNGTTQFSGSRIHTASAPASSINNSAIVVSSSAASAGFNTSSTQNSAQESSAVSSPGNGATISSSGNSSSSTSQPSSASSTSSAGASEAAIGERSTFMYPTILGSNNGLPAQTLTAYVGNTGELHLTWVQKTDSGKQQVHYGYVNQQGDLTQSLITHPPLDIVWSVDLVVSEAGNPHIVFQGLRDKTGYSLRSGNYAIYYAGAGLSARQISTNPEAAELNTAAAFNAHVNGRPVIFLDASDTAHIIYDTASNSVTKYNRYATLASENNNWQPTWLFIPSNLKKTFSPDHEYQVTPKASISGPFIRMDISDYHVYAFTANSHSQLAGYGGFTNVTDVQAVADGDGNTYAVWLRDKLAANGDEGDYAFYLARLGDNGFDELLRLPIATKSVTGNFAPVAIDPTTGHIYLMYFEGFFGSLSKTHLMVYAPEHNRIQHFILPSGIGVPYGKGSLWANNNTLSYVAYAKEHIYVTRWENIALNWEIPEPDSP